MTDISKTALFCLTPLVVGAGLFAATAGDVAAGSSSGPLRCEIVAGTANGMTRLEGVAHSDAPVHGSYQFRVTGSGTNISQAGDFDAAAGRSAQLGSVMLGGSSGGYDVRLEVRANGHTVSCAQRV